ncbi:hypothetical protein QWI49_11970 [Acinetobacter nosocomialis]|uniref:hypothetical protein n=1 Tax=Acinetobacter nosocomialis TaxID=106654 RepID=UPI00124FB6D2|nr:hypothetical protein [Acinetobacter nosocomialis]MDP7775864.1 hypothetical protein [Acinetobacter nosocomialis]
MDAGFRILNDSGVIHIDSNYRNMFLVGKQEYIIPRKQGSNFFDYTPVGEDSIFAVAIDSWWIDEYPAPNPIGNLRDLNSIVLKPSFSFNIYSYDADLLSSTSVPNNLSIYFSIPTDTLIPPADKPYKLTIYEFNFKDLEQSQSSIGLQLFDANQKLVFDSNYKPLKVLNFIQNQPARDVDFPGWANVASSFIYADPMYLPSLAPKDKKIAVAIAETPIRFQNSYSSTSSGGGGAITSSGSAIYDRYVLQKDGVYIFRGLTSSMMMDGKVAGIQAGMNTINTFIIDVTNY